MKYAAGLIFIFLFCSCSTIPSGKNWPSGSGARKGTAEVRTVRVDKNADWDSLEAETSRLLPFLLEKNGYPYSDSDENRYLVDLVLIERNYMENWKTRRSLSAEVLIIRPGEKIPMSAGKAVLTDTAKSLSSSYILHVLLNRALSGALKGLPKK
jgi:hypothetical protein